MNMKAKDLLSQNRPPSVLLYGAAGTGKTALASQIGPTGFLFDFDGGMRTALTLQDSFTPLRQAVEFETFIDDKPATPSAYISAKTKLMQFSQQSAAGKLPYKSIAVDSLTGLCRSAQLHIMGCSGNSMAVPQIQHYGMIVNEVESILTILRSMKVLLVVTAHEMLVETDTGNLIRILSATKPHGMNKLPWLFDEVLYAKARPKGQGKIEYIVSGRPSSSIATRTRSGITDDIVHNECGLAGLLKLMMYSVNDGEKGGAPTVR
jgi:hypothetical protein